MAYSELEGWRTAWLGYSPEWTAGMRRHRAVAGVVAGVLLLCSLIPCAGFPALCVAVLCCAALYAENEPLSLLLLAERGSARILVGKILTAWRNYFLAVLPFALIALFVQPCSIWMAIGWLPFAALVLMYAVLAKYAHYNPSEAHPKLPGTTWIGYLGFLIPLLLPVTLWLIVAYGLQAERNLNRYLYDYD